MSTEQVYHYVYRITNTILNKHYYGIRSSNVLPKLDLGIKYFSSSTDKEFIKDQKHFPYNYKYKIIKIVSDREKAISLEVKLHNKFNVGNNINFYNKVKQSSNKFDNSSILTESYLKEFSLARCGKGNPMYGKPVSKETREKLSMANTGKVFSIETRQKMSLAAIKRDVNGARNPRALLANIYEFGTNKLLAENIIIKQWAKDNGFGQTLYCTAKADINKPSSSRNPHQHKGIYAIFVKDLATKSRY